MYSFTKPKPKPLFKEDTKLWLIFIFASLLMYIFFSIFLNIKTYFLKKETKQLTQKIISLHQKISKIENQKAFILKEKELYEYVTIKNSLLKDSIKNLLDLIPDPITLEAFKIDKNRLIIYGITPTKDIYNLLMLPPLESIFSETKTYFYLMPNGWYKFKSENYIKSSK